MQAFFFSGWNAEFAFYYESSTQSNIFSLLFLAASALSSLLAYVLIHLAYRKARGVNSLQLGLRNVNQHLGIYIGISMLAVMIHPILFWRQTNIIYYFRSSYYAQV